mmetsp:Transcript_9191/g.16894  ORF Transcript_9191/g.16894 Transcript_9191/m.16894 type:complete len:117 (+) Transcript_9191:58-408(+)
MSLAEVQRLEEEIQAARRELEAMSGKEDKAARMAKVKEIRSLEERRWTAKAEAAKTPYSSVYTELPNLEDQPDQEGKLNQEPLWLKEREKVGGGKALRKEKKQFMRDFRRNDRLGK